MPAKRNYLMFIAYLQIIGILLVVWGHSMHQYPDGVCGSSTLLYRMPYSFRMPLFIFVSGFLMVYTTVMRGGHVGWRRFASGKVHRLLVPYVVLTLVTFLPRGLMSSMADDAPELSWQSLGACLIYADRMVIPYLWFLQTSFTLLAVTYGIIVICRRLRIADVWIFAALIAAYALLPWLPYTTTHLLSLHSTVTLAVYFALGCAYARYMDRIDRVIPWTSPLFFVAMAAVWALLFFACEENYGYTLCRLAGIMMCISAAKLLEKHQCHILDHLRGANYIIFLLSWYFNVLTQQVLAHYVAWPWWCHSILSLLCGVYVPWLFYRYMSRHTSGHAARLSRRLLGQSFPTS